MSRATHLASLVLAAGLASLLVGCGSSPDPMAVDAGTPSTSVTTTSAARSSPSTSVTTSTAERSPSTSVTTSTAERSPSASATSLPTTAMGKRCGRPDVEARTEKVPGPTGEQLAVSTVGAGPTVALLIHQTGPDASCGWWPYAHHLAANGIRAVMVDLCNFGRSICDTAEPFAYDYPAQTALVVARLRADGATRITLVGASLGGTVASVSAARAKVDAVVNLSGFGYAPMVTGPALAALTIPVLGAGSHTEESDSARLEREVAASRSPTKRFVWSAAGHGWSLVREGPLPDSPVTPLGETVMAWVKGSYTTS